MNPGDKALQSVIPSLPGCSAAIESAFGESEYFRSICSDFLLCSEALTHWDEMDSDEARARRDEYADLLRELRKEIKSWLERKEY